MLKMCSWVVVSVKSFGVWRFNVIPYMVLIRIRSVMFLDSSDSPDLHIAEDTDRVILPPLEPYTAVLIRNNFWSIFNLGAKYHIINLALKDLNDEKNTSNIILRGRQSLSFPGLCPTNIDVHDESKNMVFQIHFLIGASTCFPVLRGVHVVDTYGTTLGHIQENPFVCSRNDFIIKDYAMRITYDVVSKFNFCEGPDFVVKEKNSNLLVALIYRKGQQFMARFANAGISSSIKALIIALCLFLNVRGNLRFSNACMKP